MRLCKSGVELNQAISGKTEDQCKALTALVRLDLRRSRSLRIARQFSLSIIGEVGIKNS